MTDYIVLDNMVWIQRLVGDQHCSKVIDIIKKKCDTVILSEDIVDAYARTLEMHYRSVPSYLSSLLYTELAVMHKVVQLSGPESDMEDVHRKDRYLVRAARPYRGLIVTLDNQDLLKNRIRIEQNHKVRIMTPDEYAASKRL